VFDWQRMKTRQNSVSLSFLTPGVVPTWCIGQHEQQYSRKDREAGLHREWDTPEPGVSVKTLNETEIDPVRKSDTGDEKGKLVGDLGSSLFGLE
jgi:hypothetical protein